MSKARFLKDPTPPSIVIDYKAAVRMFAYVDAAPQEIGWFVHGEMRDKTFFIYDVLDPVPHDEAHGATCDFNDIKITDDTLVKHQARFEAMVDEELRISGGYDFTNPTIEQRLDRERRIMAMVSAETCKCRVWCHSHHTMGVSPSGQDETMGNYGAEACGAGLFVRMILNRRREIGITLYDLHQNVRYDDLTWSTNNEVDITAIVAQVKERLLGVIEIEEDKIKDMVMKSWSKKFEADIKADLDIIKPTITAAVGVSGHVTKHTQWGGDGYGSGYGVTRYTPNDDKSLEFKSTEPFNRRRGKNRSKAKESPTPTNAELAAAYAEYDDAMGGFENSSFFGARGGTSASDHPRDDFASEDDIDVVEGSRAELVAFLGETGATFAKEMMENQFTAVVV